MKDRSENRRKRALRLLTKLLKAAREAQEKGKFLALEKIISEASKLSGHLDKPQAPKFNLVNSEVVAAARNKIASINRTADNEEKIFNSTKADLRPEHNTLAIIAAKHAMLIK